jgi:hypothetical protein
MKRVLFVSLLVISVLCIVGRSNVSATEGEKADYKVVAEEVIGSGGISWLPKGNYEQLSLTVARPDGTIFKKTFQDGSSPTLDISEIRGDSNYCDGSYTYELREVLAAGKENVRRKPLTQTGYFSVQGGFIKVPSIPNEGISRVQTTDCFDDVVIEGHLGVGSGCECTMSFGNPDGIIMKGEYLQISFRDTRGNITTHNSWKIKCPDIGDGNGYFSIEDDQGEYLSDIAIFALEADAPASSLYVDSNGRVGLGTSTPAAPLHIMHEDSPSIRLEQINSPQKLWEIEGNDNYFFIDDTPADYSRPFRIQIGCPGDTLVLRNNGYVGVGTSGPNFPLEVETTGENAVIFAERTDGAQVKMSAIATQGLIGTKSNHILYFVTNNTRQMAIDTSGNVGIGVSSPSHLLHLNGGAYSDGNDWYPGSSREIKENIFDLTLEDAKETLKGLNPVRFNYKKNKEEERVGFIAEDVPDLVAINGRKNLNSMDIVAVLTRVVQEQEKTISELKEKIVELEKKIK